MESFLEGLFKDCFFLVKKKFPVRTFFALSLVGLDNVEWFLCGLPFG